MNDTKIYKVTENGFIKVQTGNQEIQTYFYSAGVEKVFQEASYIN